MSFEKCSDLRTYIEVIFFLGEEMKSCRWSIDITRYCVNYTCDIPITDSNYCWKTYHHSYEWKNASEIGREDPKRIIALIWGQGTFKQFERKQTASIYQNCNQSLDWSEKDGVIFMRIVSALSQQW